MLQWRGARAVSEARLARLAVRLRERGCARVSLRRTTSQRLAISILEVRRQLFSDLSFALGTQMQRRELARDVDETRMLAETERLRTALLTSLSHDVRTPLASILGTVTSLRSFGPLYDDEARDGMLRTAQDEHMLSLGTALVTDGIEQRLTPILRGWGELSVVPLR